MTFIISNCTYLKESQSYITHCNTKKEDVFTVFTSKPSRAISLWGWIELLSYLPPNSQTHTLWKIIMQGKSQGTRFLWSLKRRQKSLERYTNIKTESKKVYKPPLKSNDSTYSSNKKMQLELNYYGHIILDKIFHFSSFWSSFM